ncbi:hypothetical protein PFISCL1PPCAC_16316 [Pristionchus fissidentatus]|uniref:Uncharacterized protein n=1 Tax=Pristionchus fissidentatus TaxID=1538716 RepID=A0AAV5W2R3_9BILA|nr:hypothetical protein PFISCL1PPCAC_16316 [Pristionchus fissidentatus]
MRRVGTDSSNRTGVSCVESVRFDPSMSVATGTEERSVAAVTVRLAVVLGVRSGSQGLLAGLVLASKTRAMPVVADRSHSLSKVDGFGASRAGGHSHCRRAID